MIVRILKFPVLFPSFHGKTILFSSQVFSSWTDSFVSNNFCENLLLAGCCQRACVMLLERLILLLWNISILALLRTYLVVGISVLDEESVDRGGDDNYLLIRPFGWMRDFSDLSQVVLDLRIDGRVRDVMWRIIEVDQLGIILFGKLILSFSLAIKGERSVLIGCRLFGDVLWVMMNSLVDHNLLLSWFLCLSLALCIWQMRIERRVLRSLMRWRNLCFLMGSHLLIIREQLSFGLCRLSIGSKLISLVISASWPF